MIDVFFVACYVFLCFVARFDALPLLLLAFSFAALCYVMTFVDHMLPF